MKYEIGKFYQSKEWYVMIFNNKHAAYHAFKNTSLKDEYPVITTFTKAEIEDHWNGYLKKYFKKFPCEARRSNLNDLFYVVENYNDRLLRIIVGEKFGWITAGEYLQLVPETKESENV